MIVFLDSGVLGILCSSENTLTVSRCQEWFYQLLARGIYVTSSYLCDYEVRRSLQLNQFKNPIATESLENLDEMLSLIEFLPVTPNVLNLSSYLWAEIRYQGRPTAEIKNIDIDVIIGASCQLLQQEYPGQRLVVATTNVKHLSRFIEAKTWSEIIV